MVAMTSLPCYEAVIIFQTLEDVKTVLHKPHSAANFAYDRVPWQLKIRKEVFSPGEEVRSPMAVNLIFCQAQSVLTDPRLISVSLFSKNSKNRNSL